LHSLSGQVRGPGGLLDSTLRLIDLPRKVAHALLDLILFYFAIGSLIRLLSHSLLLGP
jgi:hypothetical protein